MSAASCRAGWIGLAGVLFSVCEGPASGEEPRRFEPSREVRRRFEDMARAYKGLAAYSDEGELRIEYTEVGPKGKGKSRTVKAKSQLSFARPNKIALNFGKLRIISDGTDLITVVEPYKRYHVAPAPRTITARTFVNEWYQNILFTNIGSESLQVLLSLLLAEKPVKPPVLPDFGRVVLEPDRIVGGRTYKCLLLDGKSGQESDEVPLVLGVSPEVHMLIDPDSKLLRIVEVTAPLPRTLFSALPYPPIELPPGVEGAIIADEGSATATLMHRVDWIAGKVSTELPEDSVFQFQPPPGYTRAKTFEELFDPPPIGPPPAVP